MSDFIYIRAAMKKPLRESSGARYLAGFVGQVREHLREMVGTFVGIMIILFFGIHIWTIWISFSATGILGALVTLATPMVSQVFWFIIIWVHADTLFNPYCVGLIAYIAAWAVYFQRRRRTRKRIHP